MSSLQGIGQDGQFHEPEGLWLGPPPMLPTWYADDEDGLRVEVSFHWRSYFDPEDSAETAAGADLELLLFQTVDAVRTHNRSRRGAIASAIDGGQYLKQAKGLLGHGEWSSWLKRAGIAPRTATNWMRLAATGLTAEQVVHHGGIDAAIEPLDAIARRLVNNLEVVFDALEDVLRLRPGLALAVHPLLVGIQVELESGNLGRVLELLRQVQQAIRCTPYMDWEVA